MGNFTFSWEEILDRYKYDPRSFFLLMQADPELSAAVKRGIEEERELYSEWPIEMRDWRLILAALLADATASIASPHERNRAYALVCMHAAEQFGSAPMLRMALSEIFPMYKAMKAKSLTLPSGVDGAAVDA